MKQRSAVVLLLVVSFGLIAPVELPAQSSDTREAITKVALDYGEGWYEGDADRMARALHPELAKRMISTDPSTGRSRLSQMGAMTLVQYTRGGGGLNADVENRHSEVTILDVFENAAIVRVDGPQWVDFLQMAKWNGEWVIVNVLWELKPR